MATAAAAESQTTNLASPAVMGPYNGVTGNWEFWTNPAHTNWTGLRHAISGMDHVHDFYWFVGGLVTFPQLGSQPKAAIQLSTLS